MTTATPFKIGNKYARNVLHLISVLMQNGSVTKSIAKVLSAMQRRVEYDGEKIGESLEEMERLEGAYQRYRELEDSVSDKAGMLTDLQILLNENGENRKDAVQSLKLWQVLQLYLIFAEEAQVADILAFLEHVGYETSRQAIESTLKTHKETFAIRKDGWDRFISLARKGKYAPSTSSKRK
jgi:predicted S18 family serine protease